MSPERRLFVTIFIGAIMLALAAIVIVRNKRPDDDMLATIAILGAIAVLITNLPPTK